MGWKTNDHISQDHGDYYSKLNTDLFKSTKKSSESVKIRETSKESSNNNLMEWETVQSKEKKRAIKKLSKNSDLPSVSSTKKNQSKIDNVLVRTSKLTSTDCEPNSYYLHSLTNQNEDWLKNYNYNEVKGLLSKSGRQKIITGDQMVAINQ